MKSATEQLEIIKRTCVEVISEAELLKKLEKSAEKNIPLKIKMGFDPTAPDLHLGHSLGLQKMKDFQDLGHEVYFVIGDFTARIGDPTGKSKTRPALTNDEILENAKTYQEQVFKILDPKKTKVVFNSEWCDKLGAADIIKLASQMNVARMLEREDFKNRYRSGISISIHEFLYPLMQGYDSVAMKADVEIGGQDQLFNLLVGRDLQKNAELAQQVVIILPLIEGTDGTEKMSKSMGNAIGITESPKEMFGKIMSIPDALMTRYFEFLTRVEKREYESLCKSDPRNAKIRLAKEIVSKYHDQESAEQEEQNFINQFSKKNFDEIEAEELDISGSLDKPLSKALVEWKILVSNSEARRFLEQGSCRLISKNEEQKLSVEAKVSDLPNESILKIGKRKVFRIKRA